MEKDVKGKSRHEGIEEEVDMPQNETLSLSDNDGLTDEEVFRIVGEVLAKHEGHRLRVLIDDRCKKVVLLSFKKLRSVPWIILIHLSTRFYNRSLLNLFHSMCRRVTRGADLHNFEAPRLYTGFCTLFHCVVRPHSVGSPLRKATDQMSHR